MLLLLVVCLKDIGLKKEIIDSKGGVIDYKDGLMGIGDSFLCNKITGWS